MNTQRSEERTSLLTYLDACHQKSGENLGLIGDISASGLLLITEQALPLNQDIDILIRLPDEVAEKEHIAATIRTCWQKPNLNPAEHCTGCQFLNLSEADGALLKQVAERLGFPRDIVVRRVACSD